MKKRIIFRNIRTLIVNTLATTTLSTVFLCLSAIFQNYTLWGVRVPFEILLVNFLMHIGFFLINKIELKYNIINYALMFIYLMGLLIGFGFWLDWFHANAVWIICLVGALVFACAFAIDMIRLNRDAAEINNKLKEIREREDKIQE